LGIAVACSVYGSFVTILGLSSIGIHSDEEEGGVQSATDGGQVDVETDFSVQQVNHLVAK
jgi:hypothetical protein